MLDCPRVYNIMDEALELVQEFVVAYKDRLRVEQEKVELTRDIVDSLHRMAVAQEYHTRPKPNPRPVPRARS